MEINRNNYELFFIDYWDGKLTTIQTAELIVFLEQNYDLKEEFESVENFKILPNKKITFDKKQLLKKTSVESVYPIDEFNYEEFFIAEHEGDLNDTESNAVREFIKRNPTLEKHYLLFSKLKLQSNPLIVFENKAQLKKQIPIVRLIPRYVYYSASIAASLLVVVMIYFFINNKNYKAEKYYSNRTIKQQIVPRQKHSVQNNKRDNQPIYQRNNFPSKTISTPIKIEKSYPENFAMPKSISLKNNSEIESIEKISHTEDFALKTSNNNSDIILANSNANTKNAEFLTPKKFLFKKLHYAKGDKNNNPEDNNHFNAWDIAQLGIAGFNKITNNDIKLDVNKDANNKNSSVVFATTNFEFSKKIK